MTPGSLLLLGWSAVKAFSKRPFLARGALRRVRARLRADRIVSLAGREREVWRRAAGCLACGRCDEAVASVGAADWVAAGLRDLTDVDVAVPPEASAEAWGAAESECPGRVPFRELAAVRARLAERLAGGGGPV